MYLDHWLPVCAGKVESELQELVPAGSSVTGLFSVISLPSGYTKGAVAACTGREGWGRGNKRQTYRQAGSRWPELSVGEAVSQKFCFIIELEREVGLT